MSAIKTRFFLPPESFGSDTIKLDGDTSHQISRVLRLTAGAQILLLDGIGSQYVAELVEVPKSYPVTARIVEKQVAEGEPRTFITLYQALLKGEKFEYVLQKGTEVGISKFVPVKTERSIGETVKLERWRKIIKEAAEQSRRGVLPELTEPIGFSTWLSLIKEEPLAIMAWEDEISTSLKSVLQTNNSNQISIFIGPEGGFGWIEAEFGVRMAKTVSLGQRILRAETAGVVAAAQILYERDDT